MYSSEGSKKNNLETSDYKKKSQTLPEQSESHKQHCRNPPIWKVQDSRLPPQKNIAAEK